MIAITAITVLGSELAQIKASDSRKTSVVTVVVVVLVMSFLPLVVMVLLIVVKGNVSKSEVGGCSAQLCSRR